MISQSTQKTNNVGWIGIDVSKKDFRAALAKTGQKWPATPLRELPVKRFFRTEHGLAAFVAWIEELGLPARGCGVRVVMESTGKYSTELAIWMTKNYPHFSPAIVNAQQTHAYIKSMNLREQTDDSEARALAFYGLEREPAGYEALRPEQEQLRELVRHRAHLIEQKVASTNRQGEGTESSFVRKAQQRLCRCFEREIAKTEQQMRELIMKDEKFKHDVQLLNSIYGVAFLTAVTVLAEIGDLRRFGHARQLTAFAGLSPKHKQSGSSINKPAHLCKKGNGRVRKALYMAALTAIHDRGDMQNTYVSLCAQGRPKKVALGAVMRKLLTLMRAILISGKPYDRLWKTRGTLRSIWCQT